MKRSYFYLIFISKPLQLSSHRGNNHAITAFCIVNKKARKSGEEVKQELISSMTENEKYENEELNKKAEKVEKCKDAVPIVRVYEKIIKTIKKNIIFA